jgi:peptidylprolyl isomerase
MKTALFPLSLLAAVLPLAAQTAHTNHAVHSAVAHHAYEGACIKSPELPSLIPALPADAPCEKALYTITHTPDSRVDYISPLVSTQLRDELRTSVERYSLGYVDVVKGTGELATPGKFLTVKYAGYLSTGKKFDASDDHPNKEPITFPYGTHRVIPGWDTGFEGMRVGGKRRLFIPYELGYGEGGHGPIPPKAELIFDVELVKVSDKMPEPPRPVYPTRHPPVGSTIPPGAKNRPQGNLQGDPSAGAETKK